MTYRIIGRDSGVPSLNDAVLAGYAIGDTAELTLAADLEALLIDAGLIEIVLPTDSNSVYVEVAGEYQIATGRVYHGESEPEGLDVGDVWVDTSAEPGPFAALTHSGTPAQATTSGAFLVLTWDTETEDTDGIHESVTNPTRLTAPVDGVYAIHANIDFPSGANQRRILQLRKNGTTIVWVACGSPGGTAIHMAHLAAEVRLTATDYLELMARQDSGSGMNITVNTYSPQISMRWVRP